MKPHARDSRDSAACWARASLGVLTPREEAELEAWRQNTDNAADWREIQSVMVGIDELAATPDIRLMREAALGARPVRTRTHWKWIGVAIAASLLIMLPIGAQLVHWTIPSTSAEMIVPSFYATRLGEQRDVRLKDGSIVTLDPSTQIAVTLSAKLRYIRLVKGQAMFKVAKNRDWPFVVEAGDQQITATGTAFDVQVKPNGTMSVLLVEGRVNVSPVAQSFVGGLIQSMKTKKLTPGQKLSTDGEGNQFVANFAAEEADFGESEKIIFNDSTIGDAIAQINRHSGIHIDISDPHIAALRVSGVYYAERPKDFLTALTAFYPLAVRAEGDQAMSLEWSER